MGISGSWDRRVSRKDFLSLGGLSTAALVFGAGEASAQSSGGSAGYGPLVSDPGGMLDLPRGFQYRVISEEGSRLSSGSPFRETTTAWRPSGATAAPPSWSATTS